MKIFSAKNMVVLSVLVATFLGILVGIKTDIFIGMITWMVSLLVLVFMGVGLLDIINFEDSKPKESL